MMDKSKPKNIEEVLAQKREREKLRYQSIKNNPELYAEYQRNNSIKYEKQKVQKKILLINEMTSSQRESKRKKWREERRRRHQRNKDKKAKERQLITENSPRESCFEHVQLDAPEGQENVIIKEPFRERRGSCDTTHGTVVIKEEPLCEGILLKPKRKSKEEVLATKREREKLKYQTIKCDPVLYEEYQRNNSMKYEKNKVIKKIRLINEMTSSEQEIQRKKWRKERRMRCYRDKKEKESQLNTKYSPRESCFEQVHLDASEGQENAILKEPFFEAGLSDTARDSVVIKEEPLGTEVTCASHDPLTSLYPDHDVKEELVFGPECLQRSSAPAVLHTALEEASSSARGPPTDTRNPQSGQDSPYSSKHTPKPSHTPKKHPCQTCGKEFKRAYNLKRHILTHTGLKPYSCKLMMSKPKPKNEDEVLAQKREREKLRYQTIMSNPELYAEYKRKNNMKYEKQKVQNKILLINEMTSSQREIKRKKWREEKRRRYQRDKDKKAKERQFILENSPYENVFRQVQIDASEGQENVNLTEPFCEKGSCDTAHDAMVIKEEPLGAEVSSASRNSLTSLYPDHEVKEELVLGPECLQRPGEPAALHIAVDDASSSASGLPTDTRNSQSGQESPSSSKNTLKTSHTTKKHPCQTCGKEFKRAYHLKCHMLTHTGLKPYSCEVCKKDFRFISNLIPHKRIHTGVKPFSCEICKMSFTYSGAFKSHKRIHSGVKPYSCEICYKTFRAHDALNRHKRTHSGEKPYLCIICNKRFKETGCLKKHERIHTGEQPYSCEMCEKKFTLSNNLKRHRRIHTGERPYACEICERKFSQLINLKTHQKIHSCETPL